VRLGGREVLSWLVYSCFGMYVWVCPVSLKTGLRLHSHNNCVSPAAPDARLSLKGELLRQKINKPKRGAILKRQGSSKDKTRQRQRWEKKERQDNKWQRNKRQRKTEQDRGQDKTTTKQNTRQHNTRQNNTSQGNTSHQDKTKEQNKTGQHNTITTTQSLQHNHYNTT
jgi:hypothetical protein